MSVLLTDGFNGETIRTIISKPEIHPYLISVDGETPIAGYEKMISGEILYILPKVGSDWLNLRKLEVYRVIGYGASCDSESDIFDQVIYHHSSWGLNRFRYRPLTEWYGKNRDGNWRYIEAPKYD